MFYRGVVENNLDEKFLGRVQVRILGIHSDKKEEAPTDSLPWCEVVQGTNIGMTSGVGVSSVLVHGTWVWVFFEGDDWNKPVVFGTMIGQMAEEPTDGFKADEQPDAITARLGEPDLHPFARADSSALIDTTIPAHQTKVDTKIDGIAQTAANAGTWDEPAELSSKAMYPTNNVIETKSGHIIEIDDTTGNERIQIVHKSGSYIEMGPDGTIAIKSQVDDYKIVQGNAFEHIVGNENVTVTGNVDKQIDGNLELDTVGTITIGASTPADSIVFGAGAEATVLNDSLKEYINTNITAKFLAFQTSDYDTHTHPTGVGPSGPPMAPHAEEMVDYADDAISKLVWTD